MCSSISWRDHSHGKVFQDDQRQRSMLTLKRRRRKSQLMSCARDIQIASQTCYTTAKNLVSLRTQIINISSHNLRIVWRRTTSMFKFLTSSGTRIDWFLKRKQLKRKWWRLSKRNPEPRNDMQFYSICEFEHVCFIINKKIYKFKLFQNLCISSTS